MYKVFLTVFFFFLWYFQYIAFLFVFLFFLYMEQIDDQWMRVYVLLSTVTEKSFFAMVPMGDFTSD